MEQLGINGPVRPPMQPQGESLLGKTTPGDWGKIALALIAIGMMYQNLNNRIESLERNEAVYARADVQDKQDKRIDDKLAQLAKDFEEMKNDIKEVKKLVR